MDLMIEHNIEHTQNIPYLLYNLWNFVHWRPMFAEPGTKHNHIPNVYIWLYASKPEHQSGTYLKKTWAQIEGKQGLGLFLPVVNEEEARGIIKKEVTENGGIVMIPSNALLPRSISRGDLDKVAVKEKDKNLCLPTVKYKYHYKTVKWKDREYRVKEFIKCNDPFFSYGTEFVPDWDERYHITHNLLGKLKGKLPGFSPSPLIHEWGGYCRAIKRNLCNDSGMNNDHDMKVPQMEGALHLFDYVGSPSEEVKDKEEGVSFGKDVHIPDRKFSCERQDEFVYHVLAKHLDTEGFFLDIACADPRDASNTYALEKYFGWSGIGFDIGNVEEDCNWSDHRQSTFCQVDATSPRLTQMLKDLVADKIVDYISLDVDGGETNYSAQALQRILDAGIQFKVMTLEHESFKHGSSVTAPTRQRLLDRGYQILFEDVCFEDGNAWEDWWIKPELIPVENIMGIKQKGKTFNECLDILMKFTGDDNDSV